MTPEMSERAAIPRLDFRSSAQATLTGSDWSRFIAPLFGARLDPDSAIPPGGGMTLWKIGDIVVGAVQGPPQTLVRDEDRIARQDLDHVLILFVESGGLQVVTDGTRRRVTARDVVVLDLLQPVVVEAEALSATAVFVPRRKIPTAAGHLAALHGRAFDYRDVSVRRLFHGYLRSLGDLGTGLLPHQIEGMSRATATLCAACFPAQDETHRIADAEMAAAIRRHVEAELLNPALEVKDIADRFGVSRAALYRLFSAEGGVAKYIRDRRLFRARRLLVQAGPGGPPRISTVAYATGFADEKAFSRAFKKRFGHLPRDARSGAAQGAGTNDNTSALLNWLTTSAA